MRIILFSIIFCLVDLTLFADTTTVYQLPFEEDFHTGVFTTNQWTVEGTNWIIAGQEGNPAPSAKFSYSPADTNYSLSLTSASIDGADFISGLIYLDYDIKLDVQNSSGVEKLSAEVFDGNQWVTFYTDSSTGDTDWEKRHINITSAAKGDTFQIRFRAYGENTFNIKNWQIDNIIVYRYCPEPVNLVTSFPNPVNHGDLVLLEWQAPLSPSPGISAWIHWDDGTNEDAIGIQNGGTFFTAVRFTPSQLIAYAGTSLTKMRIFPYGPNGSIILKVWTGANASQLVLSQPVSSYYAGDWNEFTLNTPVLVTGTTELWFGYEVTHNGTDYVAGVDGGPAVGGYGDMISLDGLVWESMSQAYQLDYNWNIQGWVELDTLLPYDTIDVQGYNVYLEEEWLAFTPELWYFDTIPFGNYTWCYNVSAVYQDCESGYSNMSCIWIKTNDHDIPGIKIYPNPSSSNVSIDIDPNITKICIFNLVGETIGEIDVIKSNQTYQLDLTGYHSGVYLVKFVSSSGETATRKLIVAK